MNFLDLFIRKKPMIGMIHLLPLVGFSGHPGMRRVMERALDDLASLEKGGMDGAMVENEFDHPHQVKAGPEIIAAMTSVVAEVVKIAKIPIGVEVLLNDSSASLAIAHVAGARFIRTDYFVDRMSRPEYGGEMEIDPKGLMDFRKKIGATGIFVLCDLQVKYATLLEKGKSIATSAKQAIAAGADGLIVTGTVSGRPPMIQDVKEANDASAGRVPVLVGSGFAPGNACSLLQYADGAIVGTAIKTGKNVDVEKAAKLMKIVQTCR